MTAEISANALDGARGFAQRGWSPVPVPYRRKNPILKKWQKLRITEADASGYFEGPPQNVGVLLGEPSGNLIDVDLDCLEALELAPYFLPETESTFGRASKPKSHLLFRSAIPHTSQYSDPEVKDDMLVELRSTGGQTVFPGSVHESGEPIEWYEDGDPTPIDPTALVAAVRRLASACLLRRCGFDLVEVLRLTNGSDTLPDAELVARVGEKRARRVKEWLCSPAGGAPGAEGAANDKPPLFDANAWVEPRASAEDLDALAAAIPNHDEPRNEYVAVGLGFYAADQGGEAGFAAWDAWAKKSTKYHGGTAGFWVGFQKSPPRITGIAPLIKRAQLTDPSFRLPSWDEARPSADTTDGQLAAGSTDPGPIRPKQATPALGFQLTDWNSLNAYTGEAPTQVWLVQHAIPRGVAGIVASAGDLGKSYLMLETALRVTRGLLGGTCLQSPILGGAIVSHGAAVFVTAEDSKGSVHRRLQALDPDSQRQSRSEFPLYVLPLPDAGGAFAIVADDRGKPVATPQFEALRNQLREIPDLALVVLDPLQCFVHADINADPLAAAFTMALLNQLAAETGATVLATHHVRKEREAPRNAQEARATIRGSTALVDQSRVSIVLWAPDEPDVKKACKALGAPYQPNAIVLGAVVKSNDGADRSTWTLLREPTGLLRDVTDALRTRGATRWEIETALIEAIATAAAKGRPFTRTGDNGVYKRRAELGETMAGLPRARLEGAVQDLEQAGQIVTAIASGSTVKKWLDVPGGEFALGRGAFALGAGLVAEVAA